MRRESAFTLIEIIVTLVVISVATAALIGVFTSTVRGSADPLIQQQATTIAEAYMEEILLRAFEDPQGGEMGPTGLEGESGREEYDDVQDYGSLGAGAAADQFDNPIAALADYTVTVSVIPNAFNGIADTDALRIDVEVSHPAIDPLTLSAYRTRYP